MATRVPAGLTSAAAAARPELVVDARGVSRAFGDRLVLDHLDLAIPPGEFVALLGRSGSGKSTLLRAVAGLDPAIEGRLRVAGTPAMAFQEPRLLPWRRVWANVALGLHTTRPRMVALAALAEVGLAQHADAWPLTLSGGEAQRASLARALVREPDLLLLDEPFAALDALTRISMHRLVADLWRRHRPAVLLVTHDVEEALLLADRVVVLADGHIVHATTVDLQRPRRLADPRLLALRTALLAELGVPDEGER